MHEILEFGYGAVRDPPSDVSFMVYVVMIAVGVHVFANQWMLPTNSRCIETAAAAMFVAWNRNGCAPEVFAAAARLQPQACEALRIAPR